MLYEVIPDLLVNLATLLRDNDPVRGELSGRYRYVMVDEYQDTNRLQAEIVRHLASGHSKIMVQRLTIALNKRKPEYPCRPENQMSGRNNFV